VDQILRSELVRDEGHRLVAYPDSNGFWTIGIGHLIGPVVKGDDGLVEPPRIREITDAECDALFEADVAVAVETLHRVLGTDLLLSATVNLNRWRALVNMAFNRGEKHMRESTSITPAIKQAFVSLFPAQAWFEVAKAIKASPWAKQIGARADRIADALEKG
jgi:lysozyme